LKPKDECIAYKYKDKKDKANVLHKNIKDPKHKGRVLSEPNVQKLILVKIITYKGLGYCF
jgi:hypothetical protein